MPELPQITDVDLLAFSKAIQQATPQCITQLGSKTKNVRVAAFKKVCQLVAARFEADPAMVDRIPELFSSRGDILSALSFTQARVDTGEEINATGLIELLHGACRSYTRVERQFVADSILLEENP